MKVCFVSNYFNHHQEAFSLNMYNKLNGNYSFIATTKLPEHRLELGYEDMNNKYEFIVRTYESEEENLKAQELIRDSDAVIFGSAPEKYIRSRIKEGKIVFRYSERLFKKGLIRFENLKTLVGLLFRHTIYKNKKVYMLCASAYTAGDYALAAAYKNKCYKWGYFPEVKVYDVKELLNRKNTSNIIKILWVGRFLRLKHPEKVIKVANKLKENNYSFEINMIGIGPMKPKIEQQIKKYKLEEYVKLLGAVTNRKVRNYMEDANIFLFTSDRNEGWGAVLNEAMNSACCVIASKYIGSVPFLIKENVNGLVYNRNSDRELYNKLELAINNEKLLNKLGKEAYKTIIEQWNAQNAADKLIRLISNLESNHKEIIKDGPCSKAKIVVK